MITTERISSALIKAITFGIGNFLFIVCFIILAILLEPSSGEPKILGIFFGVLFYPIFITLPATLGFLLSFLFGDNKTPFWLIFIVAGVIGLLGVVWIEEYIRKIPGIARAAAGTNENFYDFFRFSLEIVVRLGYGFVPGLMLKVFSDLSPRLPFARHAHNGKNGLN